MREEAFEPEAVDLKVRTVRDSGEQLDRDVMSACEVIGKLPRGPRFAHDSPLEQRRFELSVPP
jgi:hypothetical protein